MPYDQQKARQIWHMVSKVPAGKVASYGLIADLSGLPGRARLVGSVMHHAPPEMNLAWYRIIKSNGQIAFPLHSEMAERQKALLQEEGVVVRNNRINMSYFLWKPDLGELLSFEF